MSSAITVSELLRTVPRQVRPMVQAARKTIRDAGPKIDEIVYMANPPRAKTYMWKLLRYASGGTNVAGIGTFTKHSAIIFYRGRELDDKNGLLEGSGKDSRFIAIGSPADAARPGVTRLIRQAFKLATSGKG